MNFGKHGKVFRAQPRCRGQKFDGDFSVAMIRPMVYHHPPDAWIVHYNNGWAANWEGFRRQQVYDPAWSMIARPEGGPNSPMKFGVT